LPAVIASKASSRAGAACDFGADPEARLELHDLRA